MSNNFFSNSFDKLSPISFKVCVPISSCQLIGAFLLLELGDSVFCGEGVAAGRSDANREVFCKK